MGKKLSYRVDGDNNLSIEDKGTKILAQGRFSTDKDNRLVYWLNESGGWRRKYRLGEALFFTGKWRLNANHDLELQLEKSNPRQKNGLLVLRGNIISCDADKLIFQIKNKDRHGQLHIYFLKLDGFWQADEYNRINFIVKRNREPADILLLNGIWKLSRSQQIVYVYEKTNLKTKTKVNHSLTFSGYWQINSTQQITYIFLRDSRSRFDFRAQIESPNLYPQEGLIKYRLGWGVKTSRSSSVPRSICLYGTWKFSRDFQLYFQMNYGQGRVQKVFFGTQIRINKKDEIVLALNNSKNKPLGMNIILTHRFLKKFDARAFLRLQIQHGAPKVETGLTIPF